MLQPVKKLAQQHPIGGFLCECGCLLLFRHFCHFFTRLSLALQALVRSSFATLTSLTRFVLARPHCLCNKWKISPD